MVPSLVWLGWFIFGWLLAKLAHKQDVTGLRQAVTDLVVARSKQAYEKGFMAGREKTLAIVEEQLNAIQKEQRDED